MDIKMVKLTKPRTVFARATLMNVRRRTYSADFLNRIDKVDAHLVFMLLRHAQRGTAMCIFERVAKVAAVLL